MPFQVTAQERETAVSLSGSPAWLSITSVAVPPVARWWKMPSEALKMVRRLPAASRRRAYVRPGSRK